MNCALRVQALRLRLSLAGKQLNMKIYCISGIGGDRRLFKHIRLPEGYEVVPVDWIKPGPKEMLTDYAMRLSVQINAGEPFILLGLSLGGMIAVEIAKRMPPVGTIMISSVPLSVQLPWYFKTARKWSLYNLVPASTFKFAAMLKRIYSRESREDKRLILQMIRQGDNRFIKWAMQAALEWENEIAPTPLWHIHGDRDEVFPIQLTHPTHIIPRAGHFLLMSHSKEINDILEEIILLQLDKIGNKQFI
jgi:pimeloyl-ACP methyl ester carboxylesterase